MPYLYKIEILKKNTEIINSVKETTPVYISISYLKLKFKDFSLDLSIQWYRN